jgi:hypothetical protein
MLLVLAIIVLKRRINQPLFANKPVLKISGKTGRIKTGPARKRIGDPIMPLKAG